jgi:hypothetical protein
MSAYRIECKVDGRSDWKAVNDTTIILGHPEDSQVHFTLVFRNRQHLANFAHDINRIVGLKDNYTLFPDEPKDDDDVAVDVAEQPKSTDSPESPPANAKTNKDHEDSPDSDNLDSFDAYQMSIETPIKGIVKPSPFSDGSKSYGSPAEQMESQAVWSRY